MFATKLEFASLKKVCKSFKQEVDYKAQLFKVHLDNQIGNQPKT
jgi:hypothetical protein